MLARNRRPVVAAFGVIVVASLFMTVLFGAEVATSSDAGEEPYPRPDGMSGGEFDAAIENEQAMRETLGFNADYDYVARLIADPEGHDAEPVRQTLGYHFAPSERKEFRVRMQLQHDQGTIVEYGEKDAADQYAGLRIDHRAGGVLRVGFTEDLDEHERRLRARFPLPGRLSVVEAEHSQSELAALSDRIVDQRATLKPAGFSVVGVTPDWERGLVRVGLTAESDEILKNSTAEDELRRELALADGDVDIEVHADVPGRAGN